MKENQDIYDMKLHESIKLDKGLLDGKSQTGNFLYIRKVHGGWIYTEHGTHNFMTTFVPWDGMRPYKVLRLKSPDDLKKLNLKPPAKR